MYHFIGIDDQGQFIEAEVKDGIVNGFNGFDYIGKNRSYDGNAYLSHSSWTHEVKIKGQTYKSGEKLTIPKVSKKNMSIYETAYKADGNYCSECSTFHDSEQYQDVSFVISDDGEVFCKTCTKFEDLITEIDETNVFKVKDLTDVEVPKDFEEVETLFCDSSGLGSESERALTKNSLIDKVSQLTEEHWTLYGGLTGIGQFQVYLTLWKRAA